MMLKIVCPFCPVRYSAIIAPGSMSGLTKKPCKPALGKSYDHSCSGMLKTFLFIPALGYLYGLITRWCRNDNNNSNKNWFESILFSSSIIHKGIINSCIQQYSSGSKYTNLHKMATFGLKCVFFCPLVALIWWK